MQQHRFILRQGIRLLILIFLFSRFTMPTIAANATPLRTAQSLDEPLGERFDVDQTWGLRHEFGRGSRRIAADGLGYIHLVFQRFPNLSLPERHVYYNVWDPAIHGFLSQESARIDYWSRGGYPCLTCVSSGWCFPALHANIGQTVRSVMAIDYLQRGGAFTGFYPTTFSDTADYLWPRAAAGRDSTLHMVSMRHQSSLPENCYLLCYARGRPTWDNEGFGESIQWDDLSPESDYICFDTLTDNSVLDIVCSPIDDRVIIVYSRADTPLPDTCQNLMMLGSEDSGYNWWLHPDILTSFAPEGSLSVYKDCSALFDTDGNLHIAFLVSYISGNPPEDFWGYSEICHITEPFWTHSPIVEHFYLLNGPGHPHNNPGDGFFNVQIPSLSEDRETGHLFCSYQRFMPNQWDDNGYPMADIFISRSNDEGRHWSPGVNVTRTDGGQDTPPPLVRSEMIPALADHVSHGADGSYLDLFYLMDQGVTADTPGPHQYYYQRIPTDSIPLEASRNHPTSIPASFRLHQNYPNPFNSSTIFRFELIHDASITLRILDILGRDVAVIFQDDLLPAGEHSAVFDGSHLSSGLYFYSLSTSQESITRKMILLK